MEESSRKICARAWGPIPKGWCVHHVNGNRHDNDSMNLIAIPPRVHELIRKHYHMRDRPKRGFVSSAIVVYLKNPKKLETYILCRSSSLMGKFCKKKKKKKKKST